MDTNHEEKRLAIGLDEAAHRIGVSRRHIEMRVQAGELRTFKLGRRRMMEVAELEDFIRRQAATSR